MRNGVGDFFRVAIGGGRHRYDLPGDSIVRVAASHSFVQRPAISCSSARAASYIRITVSSSKSPEQTHDGLAGERLRRAVHPTMTSSIVFTFLFKASSY